MLFDSPAVQRLPVRAVLPSAVTYSGRKTSMGKVDSLAAGDGANRFGGQHYLDETTGDSIYRQKRFRDTTLLSEVTIRPGK